MIQEYAMNDSLQLSENFRAREFCCKCGRCKTALIDDILVAQLQAIRNHFRASVNINSGYRCADLNKAVGGDPNSSHMQGMAADIVVTGVKPAEVAKFAESMGVARIGLYDGFVHIGSGDVKRFWIGPSGKNVTTHGGQGEMAFKLQVLRRGSKGGAVRTLQKLLSIEADGSFGPRTQSALINYQRQKGLPAHGMADEPTWSELLGY